MTGQEKGDLLIQVTSS